MSTDAAIIIFSGLALLGGYLIGSIPSGLLLAKLFRLKEIPKNLDGYVSFGSLWQSKHWFLALLTPILEILKLFIVFYLVQIFDKIPGIHIFSQYIYDCPPCNTFCACLYRKWIIFGQDVKIILFVTYISFFAVMVGQMFPYWNKFKGSTGVIFATLIISTWSFYIDSYVAIPLLSTWFVILLLTRYLCLANIATIIILTIIASVLENDLLETLYFTFLALLVILGHRGHIARLLKGQEPKFSLWKKD